MKALLKRLLTVTAQTRLFSSLFSKTIVPLGYFISQQIEAPKRQQRENEERTRLECVLRKISPDQEVMHGPFKGMLYPTLDSVGSSLAPKIIGSYERELHPLIEQLCEDNYDTVVDIGCAEGFYAVGFARRLTESIVFAYDTDPRAQTLCRAMASANTVAERIHITGFCDQKTLIAATQKSQRALIISDCEGYEKDLFNSNIADDLSKHDLLIETHDFIDLEISGSIRAAFANTHTIESIYSLDDISKLREYQYAECKSLDAKQRFEIFAEYRPGRMEWLFLKANP